jgi:HAMP domain-containing protein
MTTTGSVGTTCANTTSSGIFFGSATEEEFEAQLDRDRVWDRATRPFGKKRDEQRAWSRLGVDDPHEILGGNATRNPGKAVTGTRKLPPTERRALEILEARDHWTRTEIRKQYKSLVKDLHPDMNGGNRADEDRLQEVVWAWDQIKDSRNFPMQQTIDASAGAATGHGTDLAAHLDTLIAEASMDFETLRGASRSKELGMNAIMSYRTAIIDQSEESFEELRLALEESTAALDAVGRRLAGSRRAAATEALAALAAFGEQAVLTRDAIRAQIAARERLDALAFDVQRRLQEVRDVEVARQTDLGERASGVVIAMLSILAAVSVAAVAGGTLFAMSITRRIGASMAESVAVMQELAAGNLETEITGGDQDHELGRMARALEVFRTNAITAKEAEARQKEQEKLQRERDAERDQREAEAAEAQRRVAESERREVIRRLQASIGQVVEGAAAGDFSRRITDRFAEEDFNRMADGVNRLMGNVETGIKEVARVMSRVAAGDLTERVGGRFDGLFAELQANVNESIETLARVVDDIAKECDCRDRRGRYHVCASAGTRPPRGTAGGLARGDLRRDGGDRSLRPILGGGRRQRERFRVPRHRTGRRGRSRRGVRRGRDGRYPRRVDTHRRNRLGDRRHRVPDESARAQCLGRGRPRGFRRQGLRRGGDRGACARAAVECGKPGHQGADRRKRGTGVPRRGSRRRYRRDVQEIVEGVRGMARCDGQPRHDGQRTGSRRAGSHDRASRNSMPSRRRTRARRPHRDADRGR